MLQRSLLILAFAFASTGCQAWQQLTSPENRPALKSRVARAVGGYITFSDHPEKRADAVIRVANEIHQAASSDISAGDFRAVITDAVLKHYVDVDDRRKVKFVVDLLFDEAQLALHFDLTLVPADKFPEARQLIIDLSGQALKTAQEYKDLYKD